MQNEIKSLAAARASPWPPPAPPDARAQTGQRGLGRPAGAPRLNPGRWRPVGPAIGHKSAGALAWPGPNTNSNMRARLTSSPTRGRRDGPRDMMITWAADEEQCRQFTSRTDGRRGWARFGPALFLAVGSRLAAREPVRKINHLIRRQACWRANDTPASRPFVISWRANKIYRYIKSQPEPMIVFAPAAGPPARRPESVLVALAGLGAGWPDNKRAGTGAKFMTNSLLSLSLLVVVGCCRLLPLLVGVGAAAGPVGRRLIDDLSPAHRAAPPAPIIVPIGAPLAPGVCPARRQAPSSRAKPATTN